MQKPFVALFAAATLATATCVADALPATAYVRDGLVVQYDGLENAGPGVHADDITAWKDLTGNGHDLPLNAGDTVGTNFVNILRGSRTASNDVFSAYTSITIEFNARPAAMDAAGNWDAAIVSIPYIGAFGWDGRKGAISVRRPQSASATAYYYRSYNSGYNMLSDILNAAKYQTYAACPGYGDGKTSADDPVYVNGAKVSKTDGLTWSGGTRSNSLLLTIGNTKTASDVRSIRIYGRQLSATEIAINAAVDKVRFEGAELSTVLPGYHYSEYFGRVLADALAGQLEVSGTPANLLESIPAYGVTNGVSPGASFQCSVPAVWTNAVCDVAYTCLGYKVYTNDVLYVEGNANSFTYEHPVCETGAKLVWQWRIEYRATVEAQEGGSISPAETQWVVDGGNATFTAVSDDNFEFTSFMSDDYRVSWSQSGNALTIPTVSAPFVAVATFHPAASGVATAKTWTGEGDGKNWEDGANWSPPGVPGYSDDVTIASGMVYIPHSARAHSLFIDTAATVFFTGSNTVFGPVFSSDLNTAKPVLADAADQSPRYYDILGDLTIAGKASFGALTAAPCVRVTVGGNLSVSGKVDVYAGAVETDYAKQTWQMWQKGGASFDVAGDMALSGSALVYVWSHGVSGMSVVWNVGGDVSIAQNAKLSGSYYESNSKSYGFGWAAPNGPFYKSGYGASYGGNGGGVGSGDNTYGFKYAPFYPGTSGNGNTDAGNDLGQGGGSVRIAAAGDITLNGKIYVTGGNRGNNAKRAGSGGGVWLTCRDFSAGPSALIHARGGQATQHGASAAGGGGRVTIMTGSPSAAQMAQLYATGTCDNLLVVAEDMGDPIASPWPALVNVEGGMNSENSSNPNYNNHGKAGTAVYLQNSAGKVIVTVDGNQDTTDTTPAYGVSAMATGETTFSAPAFTYLNDGKSRYPCIGYEWSDASGNSGEGDGTSVTISLAANTTVTWKWGTLEHFLDVRNGGFSTISYEAQGTNELGWYDEGTQVSVICTPEDTDTTFDAWLGDIAYGQRKNASVTIVVDKPKVVVAALHRDSSRARTLAWTGTVGDGDWFNKANWDDAGIPGKYDSVTVGSGTFQVKYPSEVEVASFAMSGSSTGYWGCRTTVSTSSDHNNMNHDKVYYTTALDSEDIRPYSLSVSGDFSLGGTARIYFGGINQTNRMDIAVGGDMTLNGTSSKTLSRMQVYGGFFQGADDAETFATGGGSVTVGRAFAMTGYSEYTPVCERRSGAPVLLKADTVSIGANARILAEGRGFGRIWWHNGTGYSQRTHGPGRSTSNTIAASYGGIGGGVTVDNTYGFVAAPFQPGSAAQAQNGYTGDLFSGGGAVRIDAREIELTGKIYAEGIGRYQVAGGSGGSVWLTCRKFILGANAKISVEGGHSTQYGNYGGGGGGRIAIGLKLGEAQIASLYRRGKTGGMVVTDFAEVTEGTLLAAKIGRPVAAANYSIIGGLGKKAPGSSGNVSSNTRANPGTAVFVETANATRLYLQ